MVSDDSESFVFKPGHFVSPLVPHTEYTGERISKYGASSILDGLNEK